MRLTIILAVIVCVLVLVYMNWTKFGLWLANKPVHTFSGKIYKDIAFGADPVQKLDIYVPPSVQSLQPDNTDDVNDAVQALPVIVFFYGGRWQEGHKDQYGFAGVALAEAGYVVVIPDYSKYPDVRFPAFIEDGAKAVDWVTRKIEQYGGNPETVFLSGHSSGAHLGALLQADQSYLNKLGNAYQSIQGFAGLAGPYDFTPKAKDLQDIFGPPDRYPQMQISTFINGDEPPFLLLWGDQDKAVGRFNLERLETKIKEKDGQVQSIIYEGINHVEIAGALSWVWRDKAPVLNDMIEFFQREQKTQNGSPE